LAQQIVQTAHIAMVAGHKFRRSDTNFCLLQVKDEDELLQIVNKLRRDNIKIEIFFEPDLDKYTSACSEPVYGEQRKLFRKYKLWQ
jgi:hypothetical protein